MKKEIEINERIESYLNGTMPAAEKESFEQLMQEDSFLAQQVDLHRQLHDVIAEGAYLHVKSELKSIHLQKVKISKTARRITGYGIGGLIIGIVLLLVIKNVIGTKEPVDENNVIPAEQITTIPVPEATIKMDTPAGEKESIISREDITRVDEPGDETRPSVALPEEIPEEKALAETEPVPVENKDSFRINNLIPAFEPAVPSVQDDIAAGSDDNVAFDCSKITIEASFTSEVSCNNKPTGSIVINRKSITGGMPPYTFSINQAAYIDTVMFASLYPGSYTIYAKDANDCISRLGTAMIGIKDCTYEDIFSPLKGDTWTIPVDRNKEGILTIYSKSGAVVYSIRVSGSETNIWNGETISGQVLPMGLYQFEITYDDGSRFAGNVTIVR